MQNMYDEKGVKMNKLLKYTFMLLCCFLLMGCLPLDKETDKKSIVCTTYAQYNWLQEIIGENNSTFELTLLIKDGADLHSYQPTIQDLAKVSSADLFVYVGGESEQWVSDALKEAKNKNMLVVDMMDVLKERIKEEEHVEGMKEDHDENEDESEYDEHVWLSLINAHEVVRYLSNEVQKLDDVHKKTYEENLVNLQEDIQKDAEEVKQVCIYQKEKRIAENTIRYLNDIDDLNHQYEQVVENATTKTLLFADRFPFRYLLDDYDLNYYAAFPGCSADVEASFYTITFLANKIDQLDLKSIFVIDQTNLKIAQTVKDNTKKKNQKIMYLDSLQSVDDQKIKDGYSYLKAMKYNLKVLKKAL